MNADKLQMTITYLQMGHPSTGTAVAPPLPSLRVTRLYDPAVAFYRHLYNGVGSGWLWYERHHMNDDSLRVIIQHPRVEIYVLYSGDTEIGYFELDGQTEGEIELAYFGLMPKFIGQGFGRYLLDRALTIAWSKRPRRVWVHTCNFDHPKAQALYERAGFVAYKQETKLIDKPRMPQDPM
jgi:GNAT superfamily N-acetyltransferase